MNTHNLSTDTRSDEVVLARMKSSFAVKERRVETGQEKWRQELVTSFHMLETTSITMGFASSMVIVFNCGNSL